MKKILSLVFTLLLILTFNNLTLAAAIDIEVTEGVSVSLEKYLKPSNLSDPIKVTGSFGFNDHLLLKCAYITEEEQNIIGGRYAFNENMAVMFEHEWDDNDDSNKYGFVYKYNLRDQLDLVGLFEYEAKDISLTGQAEYQLTDLLTANAGIRYNKPDQGDTAIDLLMGAEFKPIDIFSLYFDYIIPDEGDNRIYFGASYWF